MKKIISFIMAVLLSFTLVPNYSYAVELEASTQQEEADDIAESDSEEVGEEDIEESTTQSEEESSGEESEAEEQDEDLEQVDEGEAELKKVKGKYNNNQASKLTSDEWTKVGNKGDNCWVDANGNLTLADVSIQEKNNNTYGKVLDVKTTKKGEANYNSQLFFKLTGKVVTGDELFYAFRIRGISNEGDTEKVVTNMRIRPSNGGDANVNFQLNNITDEIDDDWTLVWGYTQAPASSADSTSIDSEGNKYGAFVLQTGMAVEEFEIADLQIYNLSSTKDAVDEPEEELERKTFDEVMELYHDGVGELASYKKLSDDGAYTVEWQDPLEDNGKDFTAKIVDVKNKDFTEAIRIKTTKTGDQAWDAQLYFNLDKDVEIKKGDTLFFGCKVRGISSVTNKEAMFVTANTRLRPDRKTSSNFDITCNINSNDESAWTQVYCGVASPTASTDVDGAWVFHLGAAAQELEIADVFVINFGKALSDKELPIMSASYLGMEEDAQWRKDALERIEQIRKQDLSILVQDEDGNPIENAKVSVEQKRHEFGFGTIINADEYAKWDADKQAKYRSAFEQISHNRAGFENALKHYYITDPDRQEEIDKWLDYFEEKDIDVRGHVLVYGSDDRLKTVDMNGVSKNLPQKDLMTSGTSEGNEALSHWIDSHINTYVEKYKGRIYNWDVVNENMTSNDWSNRLDGYDSLVHWFDVAHDADPDVKLTYNDYGILSRDKGHQDYHYDLCKYLIDNGAPITTIGIQGHVSLMSPIEIINILDRFSELGKEIEITEFTYEDSDPEFQGQFTRDFLIAVFSEEAVTSITTWGFYEGCMYQPKAAMVDNNFNLKPNGEAWHDLIFHEWWTDEATKTDAEGTASLRGFKGDYAVTVAVDGVNETFDVTLSDEPVKLSMTYTDGEIKLGDKDTDSNSDDTNEDDETIIDEPESEDNTDIDSPGAPSENHEIEEPSDSADETGEDVDSPDDKPGDNTKNSNLGIVTVIKKIIKAVTGFITKIFRI